MAGRIQRRDARLAAPDLRRPGRPRPVDHMGQQRLPCLDAGAAAAAGFPGADLTACPPDPLLIRRLGAAECLRHGLLPWQKRGGATVVLTARPGQVRRHLDRLTAIFGPIRMAHAPEAELRAALVSVAGAELVETAETCVPAQESCRRPLTHRTATRRYLPVTLVMLGLVFALAVAPVMTLSALTSLAVLVLLLGQALRLTAAAATARPARGSRPEVSPLRLPVVSVLVPLYRETGVASHLMMRLSALDYPRDLLDLCLILEDNDVMTRAALEAAEVPDWVQIISVPRGTLRTKPRALNYALNFARGTIIGIYDAEDMPAPDHIHRVVGRFARRGPDVACLQGMLDYFNSQSNWLARCFTLEYAGWFRVVLPGLARLGLVVPLGGTTLFLRRHALEDVHGWDAHNVTEDADLGLRLARRGYRTELLSIVTQEEATARPWPWVRQRTRWLKGYAVTWSVHMRDPVALWRDLGAWRFLGVQLVYLGAIVQFALAPLLWSFLLMAVALPHPFAQGWPQAAVVALVAALIMGGAANVVVLIIATRRAGKPRLAWWIPMLQLYFPLATVAVWRALWQAVVDPFSWDKTTHGIDKPTITIPLTPLLRPSPHQAEAE
ncbi:MAG: glycosyltransferase [Rubellimicrobium sp.]|nr:glycosyltransferase [Rubellimicrobium sp.]